MVAYCSVGWIERPSECFSHPPSVFYPSDLSGKAAVEAVRAPYMKTIVNLMRRDKQFTSNSRIGLSFELGTLVYTLKSAQRGISKDYVNAACKNLYVTNFDIVPCLVNTNRNRGELFKGVNVAQSLGDEKQIMLFESNDTLIYKIKQLADNATFLRGHMSFLLLNAHLGDFTNPRTATCKASDEKDRTDPFERIRVIRAELGLT